MARRKKKRTETHRITSPAVGEARSVPSEPQRAEPITGESSSPASDKVNSTSVIPVDLTASPGHGSAEPMEAPPTPQRRVDALQTGPAVNDLELAQFEAELTLKHERQLLVEEAVKQALEDRAILRERDVDAAEYEAEAKRWQRMLLISTTPDSLVQYLNFYKSQWDLDSLITAGRVAQRAFESHQRRVLVYQFAFAVVGVAVGYYSWHFDILHKNNATDGAIKAILLGLGSIIAMATAYGTKYDTELGGKWQKCCESIVDMIRQNHERELKEGITRLSFPPRSERSGVQYD